MTLLGARCWMLAMTNVKSPEIVIHFYVGSSRPHNANVCIATHAHRSCQIMRLYELYKNKFNEIQVQEDGRQQSTRTMITTRYRVLHISCSLTRNSYMFPMIYSIFFLMCNNESVDCILFILITFVSAHVSQVCALRQPIVFFFGLIVNKTR